MATDASDLITDVMKSQVEGLSTLLGQMTPAAGTPEAETAVHWAEIAARMHGIWTDYQVEQLGKVAETPHFADPASNDGGVWQRRDAQRHVQALLDQVGDPVEGD